MIIKNLLKIECFNKPKSIISFVGAGGKTTLIYSLAHDLASTNKKVIIATTAKMYYPTKNQVDCLLINPTEAEISDGIAKHNIVFIGKPFNELKVTKPDEKIFDMLHKYCDILLIEADGSRQKPLKPPDTSLIHNDSDLVVSVAGLSALGQEIANVCYKPEAVASFLNTDILHKITPEDIYKITRLVTNKKYITILRGDNNVSFNKGSGGYCNGDCTPPKDLWIYNSDDRNIKTYRD